LTTDERNAGRKRSPVCLPGSPQTSRRLQVLLADRDEELLATYREFLLRDGFDVVTATDALDCVAKLRVFAPDVLVLDPALPWGQGEGVLAMMYEDPGVPLVPVVVLTDMEDPLGRYG